ncbi:HEXIM family-containing protein [Strongyloides ratti]|uniref:HEXIM family-containing protein n=1 Tax=Strongyloides ratti TaxID=34506 RepID=A0A090MWZ4_STRRB|nr:HEXIM family-containing protein [Strongyloides ratti]CEF64539.1 HEXIM family-containing protein [Strongyloides ratti]
MPKKMKSHEEAVPFKVGSSSASYGSLSENDADEMDAVYRERRIAESSSRKRSGHPLNSRIITKNGVAIMRKRRNIVFKRNNRSRGGRRSNQDGIYESHQILTPRNDVTLVVPRAPYNTNSFLADDIEHREKTKSHGTFFINSNYRLRCYSMGSVNLSATIENHESDDTSVSSDYEDLTEFNREYDNIFMDRLNSLSKTQLASEYITLEARNSELNAEMTNYYNENMFLKRKLKEQGIQYEDLMEETIPRKRTFSGNSDTTDSTLPKTNDSDEGPFYDCKFASQSPVAV